MADSAGETPMLSAIGYGLHGIAAGVERLDRAAHRIARDGASGDLAGNLVELKRAAHDVKASLAIVRAADETIGAILDVFA